MNIGFLITARLKSSRLKLKLLLALNGFTVIERVIQRAKSIIECQDLVLCTSTLNQDFPLVRTAIKMGIYYFNGHSDDVLKRLLDASIFYDLDFFVGITADNPLFSIHHANLIVDEVKKDPAIDYIYTSGMPIGVNIYAINVKALRTVCAIKEQIDTEIWGTLINRPEIFNVKKINVEKEYVRTNYRLTLDEFDDYCLFRTLYNKFPKNTVIDVLDAYTILDANPDIAEINNHVVQLDLNDEIKRMIESHFTKKKDEILKIKEKIYNGNYL